MSLFGKFGLYLSLGFLEGQITWFQFGATELQRLRPHCQQRCWLKTASLAQGPLEDCSQERESTAQLNVSQSSSR